MTDSIMVVRRMTVSRMPFSCTTFRRMTVNIRTHLRTMISKMTDSIVVEVNDYQYKNTFQGHNQQIDPQQNDIQHNSNEESGRLQNEHLVK
jgi:hypothetical protein